jgi:hypothetical protein
MYLPGSVEQLHYMTGHLEQIRSSGWREPARDARIARQAAELRRLERVRLRAERRMLRAWRRADELRAAIEAVG